MKLHLMKRHILCVKKFDFGISRQRRINNFFVTDYTRSCYWSRMSLYHVYVKTESVHTSVQFQQSVIV